MSHQPRCGCPVPVINPPDFGWAGRQALIPPTPAAVPYPVDPSYRFPRVLTASADTRQGTSLACEPAAGCGWDVRHPMTRGLIPFNYSSYRNYGLNLATREIAELLGQAMYPIPGIWLGPVYVHMPSGNVVLQLSAPPSGPYDAVPVFTYNSLAALSNVGRGYGVSDSFQSTIQYDGSTVNLITATGKYLEYEGVGENVWGVAPGSARNGLRGKLANEGWVERQPDGMEWHYNATGNAYQILSPSGDVWSLSRDENCLVDRIVGPNDRETTISGNGSFTVKQPGDKSTVFSLSEDKNLTSVVYPGGNKIQLGYGRRHLLTSVIDDELHETELAYDSADRLSKLTVDGQTYSYKYFYDESPYANHWVEATDPAGHVTTVMHDCNVVHEVINPLNFSTKYRWYEGDDPRLKAIVDAEGNTTTLTYNTLFDGTKALSGIERPVGSFGFGYASNGRCNSISDYDSNTTAIGWDTDENRESVEDAESHRYTFLYNGHRQLEHTVDPLTERTTVVYDPDGMATSTANELADTTTFTYDPDGTAKTLKNPLNDVTSLTRDDVGRITKVQNPLGFSTDYGYDGDGALKSVTNGESETTTFTYTDGHQLTSQIDPLSHTDSWGYDSRGNLETVTNGENETTTFVYDNASRRTQSVNPLGNTTTFTHDAVGNILTEENAENDVTTFKYDDAYRLENVILPLDTPVDTFRLTFTYNGANLEKSKTNAKGEYTATVYNNLNQVAEHSGPRPGQYSYIHYDALSRPEEVIDAEGETTTSTYYADSSLKSTISPKGIRTTLTYDAAGQLQTTIVPYDNGVTVTTAVTTTIHDKAGRPEVIVDPLTNRTTTVFDKANRVKSVTNAENETATTTYDAAGRVRTTVNPLGLTTTYQYDNANRPIVETNPASESITTNYDAAGRIVNTVNPRGLTTTYDYDKADRQVEVVTPMGFTTTTVYDSNGRPIVTINPLGLGTTTVYDKANNPEVVRNAENEVTTTVHDESGNPTVVIQPKLPTEPASFRTTTTYDLLNRPLTVTDAEGDTTTTVYDKDGQIKTVTNARGKTTTMSYNAAGQPYVTIAANSARTTTAYDIAGRISSVTNPANHTTTTVYDNANRPVARINPLGDRFTTIYDDAGQAIHSIDPLLNKTTTIYDAAGRVSMTYNGESDTTEFFYDTAGRQTKTVDGNGYTTTYAYDNDDRQTVITNAESGTTENVYDAAGRVIATVNEAGNRTTSTYDNVDRLLTVTNAAGEVHTYVYDDNGRRIKRIDARSQMTTYTYDKVARETGRYYQDGTRATFTYDAVGNRETMVDWSGSYASTYDNVNQILTADSPHGNQISYTYNALGQRRTMTDPDGGVTTYSYNSADQLETIENPRNEVTTFVYDSAERQTQRQLANGTIGSMTYDRADRLEAIVNLDGTATTISSFSYLFDGVGNRESMSDNDGDAVSWTYDKTNQLKKEARTLSSDPYTQTLTYDSRGNRDVLLEDSAPTTYTYDVVNRMKKAEDASGITTFSYDANGNQAGIEEPSGDITTNLWDGENRLVEVEHDGGDITTFTFNADGLRVEKDDGIDITVFVYDGNNMLHERDDVSVVEAEFTYIPQAYAEVLSQHRDSESTFFQFDGIKNVRQLTDDAGFFTDQYSFDAFGNTRTSTGTTANSQLYKGQNLAYYKDPNIGPDEQYTLHYRNYNPKTGVFSSSDPAEDDLNLYRYVRNNPVNGDDPSGLFSDNPISEMMHHATLQYERQQHAAKTIGRSILSFFTLSQRYQKPLAEGGRTYVFNTLGVDLPPSQSELGTNDVLTEALEGRISAESNFRIAGHVQTYFNPGRQQSDNLPAAVLLVREIAPVVIVSLEITSPTQNLGMRSAGPSTLTRAISRESTLVESSLSRSASPKTVTIWNERQMRKLGEGYFQPTNPVRFEFRQSTRQTSPAFSEFFVAPRVHPALGNPNRILTQADLSIPRLPRRYGPDAGEVAPSNWGQHILNETGGQRPTGMTRPHGHHINMKAGQGSQVEFVENGKDLLEFYDIPWYRGTGPTGNLVHAPNVAGQHTTANARKLYNELFEVHRSNIDAGLTWQQSRELVMEQLQDAGRRMSRLEF